MSNLFEKVLREAEGDIEKSSEPIKGPYEVKLCTYDEAGKAALKAAKAALKKGAKINVVKWAADDWSVFGEKEDLLPYEYNKDSKWCNHSMKDALWLDQHSKDEGVYTYGNFIPNGRDVNPDFIKWQQAFDRWSDKEWSNMKYWTDEKGLKLHTGSPAGKMRFFPRQNTLQELISYGYKPAIEWEKKNPMPPVFADEAGTDPLPDEREITMFGIFNDGGNCYSSGRDTRNWYWATSEGETATEFRARLNRQAKHAAERNYHEYVDGGTGSWGVKVFKSIEEFKKACNRVGINPDLSDYE